MTEYEIERQEQKDWENMVYQKHPLIYQEHSLDMSKTCMCWGICVRKGWRNLIEELSEQIQNVIDETGILVIAKQVKEKFAMLHFYYEVIPKEDMSSEEFEEYIVKISKLIHAYENKSLHVCEDCGTQENVRTYRKGWHVTLCKECHAKDKE
jgi:hypothetical protein